MKHTVSYACVCSVGKIRQKNEDNFFCDYLCLPSKNHGLEKTLFGENILIQPQSYAVFDGIGGETNGDIAAFLAADCLRKSMMNQAENKGEQKEFLLSVCEKMNEAVCDYSAAHERVYMGATAAIIYFDEENVYICNIGDSRIYRLSDDELRLISKDHTANIPGKKKTPLTQHLGIFKDEMQIMPYVAKGTVQSGDCYLLCSDGLTDMVTDEEIKQILSEKSSPKQKAEKLLASAMDNGGVDNTTVIICEVNGDEAGLAGPLLKDKLTNMIKGFRRES